VCNKPDWYCGYTSSENQGQRDCDFVETKLKTLCINTESITLYTCSVGQKTKTLKQQRRISVRFYLQSQYPEETLYSWLHIYIIYFMHCIYKCICVCSCKGHWALCESTPCLNQTDMVGSLLSSQASALSVIVWIQLLAVMVTRAKRG